MKYFSKNLECAIVLGTFNRPDICDKSLISLLKSIKGFNVRVILVDSSNKKLSLQKFYDYENIDYLWLPGDVSMAASRNIGFEYAKEKYVFDWVMFLEDDLIYEFNWYKELISFAKKTYGKQSPHNLFYSCFTASYYKKNDETIIYDKQNDCYAEFFGARADQRLYKTNHYLSINLKWEKDLLGISSYQTGAQSHRDTMNGYCSANIGHRNLSFPVEGEISTWQGIRDIGPAAFDKRKEGYKSMIERVNQLTFSENSIINIENKVSSIIPQSKTPMTNLKYNESFFFKKVRQKIKRYFNFFNFLK